MVREEILRGEYSLDIPVDIMVSVDTKNLFHVGEGRLTHSTEGFHLTDASGELDYTQKPTASYSVNSDFNWYEIGDIVGIGDSECLYYCFPKIEGDIVTKVRLAAEEIYKLAHTQLTEIRQK